MYDFCFDQELPLNKSVLFSNQIQFKLEPPKIKLRNNGNFYKIQYFISKSCEYLR